MVRWYATIFGNEMVLGYNPDSRFAGELKQVATNDPHLYEILQQKGFRLGRGDPELEPKGYRTLFFLTWLTPTGEKALLPVAPVVFLGRLAAALKA
jgi:ABC-type molybdate transport system substrate-binding protein